MVSRLNINHLKEMAQLFPVLVLTGARQSGKTTLAKQVFPAYDYVSLEDPDQYYFAEKDPKGFLEKYSRYVIFDEVQNAPHLFSYLQRIVDETDLPGQFVLSGSQNFLLMESITQSLAGRVYIQELLPLCHAEIQTTHHLSVFEEIWMGSYPRVHAKQIQPKYFYPSYIKTYVERDVRTLLNVHDLGMFRKFMTLLAHRVGNLLNANELSKQLGVDGKTVQKWFTLLETSYLVFQLQPWHENLSKRVIKTPKIYFYDTGLLCYLLGIKRPEDLELSTYKGAVFENYALLEVFKAQHIRGLVVENYFWRDSNQREIDLIQVEGTQLRIMEMKASLTVKGEYIKALHYLDPLLGNYSARHYLLNTQLGEEQRTQETVLGWDAICAHFLAEYEG